MGINKQKTLNNNKPTKQTMEKKQNHQWLCLYRDSIYKCTSDTYKLGFD